MNLKTEAVVESRRRGCARLIGTSPYQARCNSMFSYTQSRQLGANRARSAMELCSDHASRSVPEMLKENEFHLGAINKVFASQWVSNRHVVFGTKCNKLVVIDLMTGQMVNIPMLRSSFMSLPADNPCGIHSISINPSRTLLATGGLNTNDLAVYKLPTFDPLAIGEDGHLDWIFDTKFIDDQFIVTGSRDSALALWRIGDDVVESVNKDGRPPDSVRYAHIQPVQIETCKEAEKIRALAYSTARTEIAAVSLNAMFHIWDVETFVQKGSRKLRYNKETVCMTVSDDCGLYAVGSQSHVALLDSRTTTPTSVVISQQRGFGIRSVGFNRDILTIGTGAGSLYFYDIRAQRYLERLWTLAPDASLDLKLKIGKGWLLEDESYDEMIMYDAHTNAIYTHNFDESGTQLFIAGGPLPASLSGNYAGIWR